jgi:hypothetical protein
LTGQKIDPASALAWTNSKEFHHFFPREYVKKKNLDKAGQVNALANIILLSSNSNKKISDRAPSDYLKEVAAAGGESLGDWLKCNLISEEAYQAALADDLDAFLSARAKAIDEAITTKTQ